MQKDSARAIMGNMNTDVLSLTLLYIEYDRQETAAINGPREESARLNGILEGIRRTAAILGVQDLYGKYVTPLRAAIQAEREKEASDHE